MFITIFLSLDIKRDTIHDSFSINSQVQSLDHLCISHGKNVKYLALMMNEMVETVYHSTACKFRF